MEKESELILKKIHNISNLISIINTTQQTENNIPGILLWKNESYNLTNSMIEKGKLENLNKTNELKNYIEFYERKKPKISIIITVYNQEKFLLRVYSSIINQTFKDIEIIFIDDASTDNFILNN